MLHDAELADSVILLNHCIAQRIDGHKPPVIRTAVRLINHAHVIRLNDSEILICAAARYDMRLISFGQLHRNAQRNQTELIFLQFHRLGGPQIDPVRLPVDILQPLNCII